MKKMLAVSLVALGLVALSEQRASAWTKFNFGVGLNLSYEGGGNTALWGLLKGSPTPGTVADGNCPKGFHGGFPSGGFDDSSFAPAPTEPKPMPAPPEKVGPPTPLKPASYNQYQQPQQNQQAQEYQEYQQYLRHQQYEQYRQQYQQAPQTPAVTDEDSSGYYFPSYYYGR